jgi:hypothetical protein
VRDQGGQERAEARAAAAHGVSVGRVGARGWLEVAAELLAERDLGAASVALDRCESGLQRHPSPLVSRRAAWMRQWTVTPEPPADTRYLVEDGDRPSPVSFGVLDYRTPDRAVQSRNRGDYIQSLAALGHVARHTGLRLLGDSDLAVETRALQSRISGAIRIEGPSRDAIVVPVNRDASNYQEIPHGTWTILFGWFMHPLFGSLTDFPLHPSVRPIPISFHCHTRSMLTDEAVDYLRHYGPVGCRDLSTLRLLRSLDVPAFFSGCVTTTVGLGFPPLVEADRPDQNSVVVVDADAPDAPVTAPRLTHHDVRVLSRSLAANIGDAVSLLDHYRRGYSRMITSRLHAYLPATALGLRVDFRPKRPNDRRFAGLAPLDEPSLLAMQERISSHLSHAIGAVVAGGDDETVRAAWREAVDADVTAARVLVGR